MAFVSVVFLFSQVLFALPQFHLQHAEKKGEEYQRPPHIELSLMHRRSGNTLVNYPPIQHGDTVHYYLRSHNPMFRVYSFRNRTGSHVDSVHVRVYRYQQLLDRYRPQIQPGDPLSFVETKVYEKETSERLTLYLAPDKGSLQPGRFELIILYDRKFFEN